MKTARFCCTLLLLSGMAPARADSELERLRTQNAALKAQVQALQQACPAAAASLRSPAPAQAAVSASPATASAAVSPPPPPAPRALPPPPPPVDAAVTEAVVVPAQDVVAAPAPAVAAAPAPPQAPAGYKLVKIDPAASSADAENCQQGMFTNTKDAPWKHEENWRALTRRMLPAAVETALGNHHTSFVKGARTLWEYGKCDNSAAQASVVFDADGLLFWKQPDF